MKQFQIVQLDNQDFSRLRSGQQISISFGEQSIQLTFGRSYKKSLRPEADASALDPSTAFKCPVCEKLFKTKTGMMGHKRFIHKKNGKVAAKGGKS